MTATLTQATLEQHVEYEIQARRSDDAAKGIMQVSGKAVRYGALIESVGRVFVPGAFEQSLSRDLDKKPLVMGFEHHRMARFVPIGRWYQAEEKRDGLFLSDGRISDTSDGRDAATLLEDGAVTGLSIGFMPEAFQFAEPKERVQFDTPFGKQTYQFNDWVIYIVQGDIAETSIVSTPADDEGRIGRTVRQSAFEKAAIAMPALKGEPTWEDAAYSMALLMGGRGAAAFADLPDVEHFALYTKLADAYVTLGKTPPAYDRHPDYGRVVFQHDERHVFQDRYLRKSLAAVAAGAMGLEGQLSPETRAEAEKAMQAVDRLMCDPDVRALAEIEGSLRKAISTLRKDQD